MACCPSLWYCTPDGPVEVLPDPSGIYTPPAGWDGSEPQLTEAAALLRCPTVPAAGDLTCCTGESSASVWFSLSGGLGSVEGMWDGTYWSYSGDPGCGATLYLRYTTTCTVEYSCDGVTWAVATAGGGSITCGPFADTNDYQTNWKNISVGCSPTNPCFGTAVVTGVSL